MKTLLLILLTISVSSLFTFAKDDPMFDNYFKDQTMRIDYYHIGDAKTEVVTIDKVYKYGIWAGSKTNLIDNFNNGKFYYKIYDLKSGDLIYSKGFDSYFGEYVTSQEALDGIKRTYQESAIIPYPKAKIKFTLERRNRQNKLIEVYSTEIDPASISVIKMNYPEKDVKITKSAFSGDPHVKVDVAIIGEGYSKKDEAKFDKDLQRFTKIFFSQEPYKSMKDKFNIYGVFKASEESGVSEPTHGSFKNTLLGATFNSLGSERYLLTENIFKLHDVAGNVPCDAIYIMVNSKRYGGGGIYNFYCTFTSDNEWAAYVFLHEFGHSFTGLADEYYTSDVSYNDFYPKGVEPVEPNITALLDPNNLKWKDLASPGIEIPTPWKKAEFDSMDYAWQKQRRAMNSKIAELTRNGAPQSEIDKLQNEYNESDKEHQTKIDEFFHASKFWGKVGAFEGAGYSAKGLYRPMLDCIMFSKGVKPFCKVCEASIKKVIESYTE